MLCHNNWSHGKPVIFVFFTSQYFMRQTQEVSLSSQDQNRDSKTQGRKRSKNVAWKVNLHSFSLYWDYPCPHTKSYVRKPPWNRIPRNHFWVAWFNFLGGFETNVSIFCVISFNAFWKFLWLRNSALDFLGGLNFGPGIFLGFVWSPRDFFGFWFLSHSNIPVTWNLEYPPWAKCKIVVLPTIVCLIVFHVLVAVALWDFKVPKNNS